MWKQETELAACSSLVIMETFGVHFRVLYSKESFEADTSKKYENRVACNQYFLKTNLCSILHLWILEAAVDVGVDLRKHLVKDFP